MELELLHKLKAEHIQQLEQDTSLLLDGYKIIYAVDNHDIVEYCFPLGIDGSDKKKSLDLIGDEHLAYNFLFSVLNEKLFLPNEYIVEILNERNKIIDKSGIVENVKNNLEKTFLLPILNIENENEKEKKLKELEEHLSFLLSFAIMAPNSVKRFLEILQTKITLTIDEYDSAASTSAEIISDSEHSAIVKKAFEEWLDTQQDIDRQKMQRLYKKPNSDIFIFLDSVYRDISALTSVLLYNKSLASRGKKAIILFHSSTPKRSYSLMQLSSIKNLLPIVDGCSYQILRSKAQSYLLSLLWDKDVDLSDLKQRLHQIYQIALEADKSENIRKEVVKKFKLQREVLEYVNKEGRSALENSLVLKQIKEFKDYQTSIFKQIEVYNSNQVKDFKEIAGVYKNIINIARENTIDIKRGLAEANLGLNYSIQNNLFSIILAIKDKNSFSVEKGEDAIRGTFHHLPILLFYDQRYISDAAKSLLNPLIEYCIFPKKQRENLVQYFIKYLKDYNQYYKGRNHGEASLNIISVLLLMLIPRLKIDDGREQLRRNAAKEVDVVLALYDGYKKLRKDKKSDIDYYKEALYLKVWVLRRIKDFQGSEKAARVGLGLYKEDPRFYHGIALTLYATEYRTPEKGGLSCFGKISKVNEVIKYTQSAKKLYKKGKNKNTIINLTVASIDNMLVHLYTERYKISKKKKVADIDQSRNSLNLLKKNISQESRSYKEYPEFLHTEANLEVEEALLFEKKDDIDNAIKKIYNAEDAICAAIELTEKNDLYQMTREYILEIKRRLTKAKKSMSK